jgi:hypothetical protein
MKEINLSTGEVTASNPAGRGFIKRIDSAQVEAENAPNRIEQSQFYAGEVFSGEV